MNRSLVVLAAVLTAGAAGSSPALLAGQQNQPGLPTLAKVHILNRDRADAVPVTVVGEPTVLLSPTAVVATRVARQLWEYRRLAVPTAQDSTPALNTAGNEGWEAVAAATVGDNVVWTLKRPR